MNKYKVTKTWELFLQYASTLRDAQRRAADMALKAYKGTLTQRVINLAERTGFKFEETIIELTSDETRWLEIYYKLDSLDYEAKMLADTTGQDAFAATAGIYDDGSISARLEEIRKEREALEAEKATLWEAEEELTKGGINNWKLCDRLITKT